MPSICQASFFSLSALFAAVACAATPEIPSSLQAPAGEELFLEARAAGVQIYECGAKPGDTAAYAWNFRAPEASLADAAGRPIGKHYGGPTWEALDGSRVVGEVKARDAGPDASAIPWLLLSAKSSAGTGTFEGTRSVQRVSTAGGNAPAASCGAANAGEVARVPYSATYYFYRSRPAYKY